MVFLLLPWSLELVWLVGKKDHDEFVVISRISYSDLPFFNISGILGAVFQGFH